MNRTSMSKPINCRPARKIINLSKKNQEPSRIPQITIQLDSMLDEAYRELRSQPRKSMFVGQPDIYKFPNPILKEYVTSIYNEYNINDPMLMSHRASKQISTGQTHLPDARSYNQSYQTPKRDKSDMSHALHEKSTKAKSKTRSKIDKLKQNFEEELNSKMLGLGAVGGTRSQQQHAIPAPPDNQIQQTTVKLRRSRAESQRCIQQKQQLQQQCFLSPQKKGPRYCFACELELFTSTQSESHVKTCRLVIGLQHGKASRPLSALAVLGIVQQKIEALKQELVEVSNQLQDELSTLEQRVLRVVSQTNTERQDSSHSNIEQMVKNSKMVESWKLLDKLQWYIEVRSRMSQGHNFESLIGVDCY